MKHLNNYIFENIEDLLNYLKNNSVFKNFTQKRKDLIEYVITADDNTIKKLSNTQAKETADAKELITSWINSKMNNDKNIDHKKTFIGVILSLCEEYDCFDQVVYLCENQTGKIQHPDNISPFINLDFNKHISINDICEYYNKYFNDIKDPIPFEFWNSLFKREAAGQPVIGKGEFILRFISDVPKQIPGGDVQINGVGVEVKNLSTSEAKLGNEEKGSVVPIFMFLNNVSQKLGNIGQIEETTIPKQINASNPKQEKIVKVLNNINSVDDEFLVNNLKTALESSFYKNDTTIKDIDKYDDAIKKAISSLKKLNNIKDFEQALKIFTALYIIIYCNEENAKYLCVIDNDKKFRFLYANINEFDNLLNSNDLPFYKIRKDKNQNTINIAYKIIHKK